jgi:hypothetical protein
MDIIEEGEMDDKDYLTAAFDVDEYLKRHPDLDPEIVRRFAPLAESVDEEMYAFIMSYIVL